MRYDARLWDISYVDGVVGGASVRSNEPEVKTTMGEVYHSAGQVQEGRRTGYFDRGGCGFTQSIIDGDQTMTKNVPRFYRLYRLRFPQNANSKRKVFVSSYRLSTSISAGLAA